MKYDYFVVREDVKFDNGYMGKSWASEPLFSEIDARGVEVMSIAVVNEDGKLVAYAACRLQALMGGRKI